VISTFCIAAVSVISNSRDVASIPAVRDHALNQLHTDPADELTR